MGYCWKELGHLCEGFFADTTLFPPFLQGCTIRYLCYFFYLTHLFQKFYLSFVGSDPDPSLFWCNNETAVSGQSLESCKNNSVHR